MLVKITPMNQDQAERAVQTLHRTAISLCLTALLSATGSVHAVDVPGGATPGGIMPDITDMPKAPVAVDVFPIPPVIERPLDVEEGPVLVVQRFALKGVVDHPERNLTVADVQRLVDARHAAKPEGFTIGQLQELANDVTQLYRDAGFILAQAFIPAQDVESGVVTLEVLEGKLGKVMTEGNNRYSTSVLSAPFTDLIGQPVTKESLESAVLTMTDYPGLTAFSVLQPGDNVGETALVLKVQKEQPYDVNVRLDNHGTEFIGEYRLLATGKLNNITGAADTLSATLLTTSKPNNTIYGDIRYIRPVISPDYKLGAAYSHNSFDVGSELADLDISGTTDIFNVYLRKDFIRGRQKNLYGLIDLAAERATVDQTAAVNQEDRLTVLTLEGGFDSIDTRFNGINTGTAQLSHGFSDVLGAMGDDDPDSTRTGGSGEKAGGDFTKLEISYSRLQSLFKNNSLLLRAHGQYSNDLLTSLEQFQMGGPNSVRAYPVAEYLRDSGMYVSLDYLVNAPGFSDKPAFGNRTWGELLQFSVFVDAARGWMNDPLANEEREVTLKGAGIGVQFNMPGRFFARLSLATQIGDRDPSNGRDPQTYFDLRYDFF